MATDKFSTDEYLSDLNAYWRAANYLAATQLYLLDNPLLREPLTREQIKKKIVGHWGTVPGQNFIYAHMDRAINKYDLDMMIRKQLAEFLPIISGARMLYDYLDYLLPE